MATNTDPAGTRTSGAQAPIVIDLGKQRRKRVKELRQGQGELMDDISKCIQELQTSGSLSTSAQPVVIIVRQRPRRRAVWPLG